MSVLEYLSRLEVSETLRPASVVPIPSIPYLNISGTQFCLSIFWSPERTKELILYYYYNSTFLPLIMVYRLCTSYFITGVCRILKWAFCKFMFYP